MTSVFEERCLSVVNYVHKEVFPEIKTPVQCIFTHRQGLPAGVAFPHSSKPAILLNAGHQDLHMETASVVVHEFVHLLRGIGHDKNFWKEYNKRILVARK